MTSRGRTWRVLLVAYLVASGIHTAWLGLGVLWGWAS